MPLKFNWFKKKTKENEKSKIVFSSPSGNVVITPNLKKKKRTKEDEKLEKEILDIASKLASRMKVYPEGLKALDIKGKKAMLDLLKKWELEFVEGITYNVLTINNWGKNKEAFNEVVKMLCDELYRLLKIKINAKDYITEYQFENLKLRSKFAFPIREDVGTKEQGLLNTAKHNIQAKIKGHERYKDIDLIGVRKFFVSLENLPRLLKIIENDEAFKNYTYPIYLQMRFVFYTSVYNFDRYVNFAKKIDEYLDITKANYVDVRKRILDALDEATADKFKGTKLSNKTTKDILNEMGDTGFITLVYMRNFYFDKEYLTKHPNMLKKLSRIVEFTQSTLQSKDITKDLLVPSFYVTTELEALASYGCFLFINDSAGINMRLLSLPLPNKPRKL
jgi:hypothetical protein